MLKMSIKLSLMIIDNIEFELCLLYSFDVINFIKSNDIKYKWIMIIKEIQ